MNKVYILYFERGSYSDHAVTVIGVFSTPELAEAAAVCVDDGVVDRSEHNPDYSMWQSWAGWKAHPYHETSRIRENVTYYRYREDQGKSKGEMVTKEYSEEFFSVVEYVIDKAGD